MNIPFLIGSNIIRAEMLKKDWITENTTDFEYKKYLLLAYLQQVAAEFEEVKLYPHFGELKNHYRNLTELKNQKEALSDSFPKELEKVDMKELRLIYTKIFRDAELLQEIEEIIEYAIPKFEHYIDEGKSIREFIENNLNFSPVGVIPLYTDEGYLFIQNATNNTHVYQYNARLFNNQPEEERYVRTQYISTFSMRIQDSLEWIKSRLRNNYPQWPNPAVYVASSEMTFPVAETLLPIARKMLGRLVACRP